MLCPAQATTPPTEVAESLLAGDELLGHFAGALAEGAHLAVIGHGRERLDQLGQTDGTGPPDDARRNILGIIQNARQFTLPKIPDPDPAVQSEVGRSPHAAHKPDDLLLNEHLVNDLWTAGTPIYQLRLADGSEMLPLLFGQWHPHRP
jgi:hypothetical protein